MRGLKTYQLPYDALENCIAYVMQLERTNSKDFFELGVFRVFVTFLFDLGRGAEPDELKKICEFENRIIQKFFSKYNSNEKMRLFSGLDIPFLQRLAIVLFCFLFETRLVCIISRRMNKWK